MQQPTWRKATYSGGNGGGCIEVGAVGTASRQIFVRDTTHRQGPALKFPPGAWQKFADKVRAENP